MAEPNYRWAGAIPLTQAAPTQRILAIAEDPATLERIAAAIQAGGATPVLVRSLKMLETAPDQLPFRFAVYAWDGSEGGLKVVTGKMREGAQLVGVTPTSCAPSRILDVTTLRPPSEPSQA